MVHFGRACFSCWNALVLAVALARSSQLTASASALDAGSSFVLDTPRHVYVWLGAQSDRYQHFKAAMLATRLRSLWHRLPGSSVVITTQGQEPDEFWEFLGGKKDIAPAPDPDEEGTAPFSLLPCLLACLLARLLFPPWEATAQDSDCTAACFAIAPSHSAPVCVFTDPPACLRFCWWPFLSVRVPAFPPSSSLVSLRRVSRSNQPDEKKLPGDLYKVKPPPQPADDADAPEAEADAGVLIEAVDAASQALIMEAEWLDPRFAFVLDCDSELFVWAGSKAPPAVRVRALRLCLCCPRSFPLLPALYCVFSTPGSE